MPTLPKIGLLKGLGLTLKTMLRPATTAQYPHVKPDLPPRTRGVIALMEENCTVCMLCARECPDWCIYIDSHKETIPAREPGGRDRTRNALDRFAIDFALCMYCGICIEVCPFDALFWSPEFEYSTYSIRELTHEKEQLRAWMDTVPPPPELEVGAENPSEVADGLKAARKAAEAQAAARQSAARAPEQAGQPQAVGPRPGGRPQAPEAGGTPPGGRPQAPQAPEAGGPLPGGRPQAPQAPEAGGPLREEVHVEAQVDQEVFDRLIAEGASERVARAKAKAAYVRREKQRLRAGEGSA